MERAIVPALQLLLTGFGAAGGGTVDAAGGRAVINTMLVASPDPLGLVSQPFDPAPFLLPVPVALGAMLAAARRPFTSAFIVLLVAAVGLFAACLAAVSGVAHEAARLGVTQMAEMAGANEVRLVPSRVPDARTAAWLDAVRNVIVHVNLFIIPLIIFPLTRRPRRRFSGYPQYIGTPAQSPRGAVAR